MHSVFLPRESHGQRSLVGYRSRGDTTLRFLKCAHFPSLFILNFAFSSVTEPVLYWERRGPVIPKLGLWHEFQMKKVMHVWMGRSTLLFLGESVTDKLFLFLRDVSEGWRADSVTEGISGQVRAYKSSPTKVPAVSARTPVYSRPRLTCPPQGS